MLFELVTLVAPYYAEHAAKTERGAARNDAWFEVSQVSGGRGDRGGGASLLTLVQLVVRGVAPRMPSNLTVYVARVWLSRRVAAALSLTAPVGQHAVDATGVARARALLDEQRRQSSVGRAALRVAVALATRRLLLLLASKALNCPHQSN